LTWEQHNSPTHYNIYRTTTPGQDYVLVASVTNSDPEHPANPRTGYTDDGGNVHPVSQMPPTYYEAGTAANWYAAFLHQNITTDSSNGVSVNGLAYGFAYDDQGGSSTNFQATGITAVAVHLKPWGIEEQATPPAPTPKVPATIDFVMQPQAGKKKSMNTVEFKVLTRHGHTFFGGAEVKVEMIGLLKGSYTVITDDSTGIGTLSFKNSKAGPSMLKLTLEDGSEFHSNVFQVGPQKSSKAVIKALNKADKYTNTSALRAALDLITEVAKKKK
jgi:hypothetical protein